MAEIKVMSAGAVKSVVSGLGAEFECNAGNKQNLNFGTAGSLRERIKDGENADLVVLSESAIAELMKLGLVVADTVVDLGRTVTGVVVREGGSVPDISTTEAFKQAALNARSVAYTDPKAGGSGGIMFSALLEKLGIAEAINKKRCLERAATMLRHRSLKAAQRSGQRLSVRFPKPCCASLAIRQLVLAGLLQAWSPLFRIVKDLARRHGFT